MAAESFSIAKNLVLSILAAFLGHTYNRLNLAVNFRASPFVQPQTFEGTDCDFTFPTSHQGQPMFP